MTSRRGRNARRATSSRARRATVRLPLALVVVVVVVVVAATSSMLATPGGASIQQTPSQPPPSQPAGQGQPGQGQPGQGQPGQGQPGAGQVAPNDSPAFDQAARRGVLLVATEASILDSLGAFGGTLPPVLGDALDRVQLPGGDAATRLARLDDVDHQGEIVKDTLLQSSAPPSKETAAVLSALSTEDREAAALGDEISVSAQTYLDALDDLVYRKGRPLRSGEHTDDGDALGSKIVIIIAEVSTPTTTTVSTLPPPLPTTRAPSPTGGPTPPSGGFGGPLVVIIVVGLLAVGVFVVTAVVRGRRPVPPEDTMPTTDDLTGLLEVTRRLASATSVAAVERGAVREALGLVPAVAGAIVRRGATELELGFETEDLLVASHLEASLIRQSADTGQPVLQVSTTERAIRSLPAAVIAVPVVASGQVEAVLVLVRDATAPFNEKERDLLVALAPITATAMQSARHADALAEASLVDGLTGVGNRRRLDSELPEILTRFAGGTSALMMIDLDHFKVVNDRYGHPAGDILLRKVAALLEGQVRPADRVYRYGGEEFSVILPEISADEAAQVAERVAAVIREKSFNAGVDTPLHISISIGLAITAGTDAVDLISRADAALYEAKQSGRDRVVVAPTIAPLTDPDE